jgi:site-specific DNA-methyltransferase (adenine-specific)
MQAFIELTTLEGQLVIDPFCGSGSTLLAAKKSGRKYIGFEINQEYARVARERLEKIYSRQDSLELVAG